LQQHPEYGRLYSASDVVAFLGCKHRTTLDLIRLGGWAERPVEADAATQLVQEYGDRHEQAYLAELKSCGLKVVEINKKSPLAEQVQQTRCAMQSGAEIIFQAALLQSPFLGYADFLIRVQGVSKHGDYLYEVADTKLAKSSQAKFLVQLCLYADLLAAEQGALPENLHIVLGTLTAPERQQRGLQPGQPNVDKLRTRDFIHYFRTVRSAFLDFVTTRPETRPLPTPACSLCGWREHCNAEWETNDHLCRVANIRRTQIDKLESAGIASMAALAKLNRPVQGIGCPVLAKLKRQADLQQRPTDANENLRVEFLPRREDGQPAGFELLPEPDPGDLYFDMEGFPHEPGGLEYLFGVGWVEADDEQSFRFKPFWAHDRAAERLAFEQFMDFVDQHLQRYPKAHIYHYAPYEKTAIKRLSGTHNTRAELRDQLLREHRLVDLYRVVSSGLLMALPSYSIKKVEKYYWGERQGEVANAGESIVQYEAFRVALDQDEKARLLETIEAYNRDDVESTWRLHVWLESIRPPNAMRAQLPVPNAIDPEPVNEREARELQAQQKLAQWVQSQPADGQQSAARLAELLGQVVGFYWRCKLPTFWRIFERMEADPEDLKDDLDCLAMLEFTGVKAAEKQSIRYCYHVPAQETKLYTGASISCLTDNLPASKLTYDEDQGKASFTRSARTAAPPQVITLCANDNISTTPKLDAIYNFVDRLCAGAAIDSAVTSILLRRSPEIADLQPGEPVVSAATLDVIHSAVSRLRGSHLVIQGPPGTGKTTVASQVIARLLRTGSKVAITSNSHAAINHLLKASAAHTAELGADITAAVVRRDDELPSNIQIVDSSQIDPAQQQLVGGTAWLFCRVEQHQKWDYLFVDEASQVSLADVIAAGVCAHNIVLLGDQMQLPQPTQGVHPGESGLSALEFLMQGHATVPPEQGIFLGETFRMHPNVCRPISEGVYEARLQSAAPCSIQQLVLDEHADPALRATGVVWVPVDHQGYSQACPEEVARIKTLYASLLAQRWTDKMGQTRSIQQRDILVLAPYNAQVRALKTALGDDARVGTVDKFQGQEAAVAICSMTSSDADSMPRGLDFLFSLNRLNVAISRAQCLALLVASPHLKTAPCNTVEDMRLLNFYSLLTPSSGYNP
jgi:uncharacterized protein